MSLEGSVRLQSFTTTFSETALFTFTSIYCLSFGLLSFTACVMVKHFHSLQSHAVHILIFLHDLRSMSTTSTSRA